VEHANYLDFLQGGITPIKLRSMERVYRRFKAELATELGQANALFEEEALHFWDDMQAEGLLSLVNNAQLNPDYWLSIRWAERKKHNSQEIAGLLGFTEFYLNRAYEVYAKSSGIDIIALYVYTWSQYVGDIINLWKKAGKPWDV
jgi:hypothetical protein